MRRRLYLRSKRMSTELFEDRIETKEKVKYDNTERCRSKEVAVHRLLMSGKFRGRNFC